MQIPSTLILHQSICHYLPLHSPAGTRTPVVAVVKGSAGHVLKARVQFILAARLTLALVQDNSDGEDEEESEGDGRSDAGPHIVGRVEFLKEAMKKDGQRSGFYCRLSRIF